MLDAIKLSLGINIGDFDTDIQDYIDACNIDLETSGIKIPVSDNKCYSFYKVAVKSYCKFSYTDDPSDYEKYQGIYNSLKIKMKLLPEFRSDIDV